MHTRWQTTALSGEGAALYPGRWNQAGLRAVYLADSLALAVLETLVHLEATATTEPYVAIEVDVPDEAIESPVAWPAGWENDLAVTRGIGSEWLRSGKTLALRVPTALVPDGGHLLVNPTHPDLAQIRESRQLQFRWDDRLL